MLFDITIPEIPIIITLEPQNSAYVYSGHCSENRTLFPSILSKIRIYSGQKSPENEKYPIFDLDTVQTGLQPFFSVFWALQQHKKYLT